MIGDYFVTASCGEDAWALMTMICTNPVGRMMMTYRSPDFRSWSRAKALSQLFLLVNQVELFVIAGKREQPIDLRGAPPVDCGEESLRARLDPFVGPIESTALGQQLVQYLDRLLVQTAGEKRQALINVLNKELGTTDIVSAKTYMEDSLRLVVHMIMSEPEYQLG